MFCDRDRHLSHTVGDSCSLRVALSQREEADSSGKMREWLMEVLGLELNYGPAVFGPQSMTLSCSRRRGREEKGESKPLLRHTVFACSKDPATRGSAYPTWPSAVCMRTEWKALPGIPAP